MGLWKYLLLDILALHMRHIYTVHGGKYGW